MDIAANIAIILTPIVIGGGFYFAYKHWKATEGQLEATDRQWQATRNARMAQIILSLAQRWESQEIQKSRCKVSECGNRLLEELKRADKENSADLCHLVAVANFFDFLGSMVMYGYFDVSTAYDLYWRAEEHYYELYRPILQDSDYKNYFECY